MRLHLIRHCPAATRPGTLLGSTDPACRIDRSRLAELAGRLPQVDAWYCSPMLRTVQTLEGLADQGCRPAGCIMEPRLREIDFGAWEGRTFAEIAAEEPDAVQAWADLQDFSFPGGESIEAFIQRCRQMLAEFRDQGAAQVAAVTHGGVIRMLICLALNLPVSNYLLFQVGSPSLTVIELHSDGGVLAGLNI